MSGWISVEDRLPEVGQRVLVVVHGWESDEHTYLGELDPCDWKLSGWSYFRRPDVRYWMPVPEAPAEGVPDGK